MDMMQMNGMGAGGTIMMVVMMLFWVVVVGAVAWLVWRAVRGRSGSGSAGSQSPEAILKERYARGEIDQPTYERMREELEKGVDRP